MKHHATRLAAFIPHISILIGIYLVGNAWSAILIYHAGIVLVLALGKPPGLRGAVRSGWRTGAAVAGGLVCALGGAVLYGLWPQVRLDGLELAPSLEQLGLHGWVWWVFVLYFVTAHPVLEEAFWRFYMGGDRLGPGLFAGYHVLVLLLFVKPVWLIVSVVVLAFAAWGWGLAAVRWRGLAVPIFTHAVADLSIMIAVTAMRAAERTLS